MKREHKKHTYLLTTFACLVAFCFYVFLTANHHGGKQAAERIKHVRVNDVDYDIPEKYFAVMVPRETEDYQIYINFMFPDFSPPESRRESSLEKEKRKYLFRDLAQDARFMLSIEELGASYLVRNHREVMTGYEYGLEVYDPESEKGSGHEVPYIGRNNGKIVTLIACSEAKFKGSDVLGIPLCNHFFYDGILIHKLSYLKEFLKDWKLIEDKTKALFQDFQKRAKDNKRSEVMIPDHLVLDRLKELKRIH